MYNIIIKCHLYTMYVGIIIISLIFEMQIGINKHFLEIIKQIYFMFQ